ncbi:MAG: response regulator transcription factor [Bacteroidales bacterium]|nr:response regulator transcription factor [Bacteroidales bacterium]MBN2817398.1 response regulator transcription factor [Bacteroidales bacterium]
MISCVIIEDEPLATEKLEDFVGKVPFLSLLGSFDKPVEGLNFLKENQIDLIFLDIQMEQLTGIQLLETMNQKPYIIITSAYSEYALKGYELQVFDYLLKPYSFDRFLTAVNRIYDDMLDRQKTANSSPNIFIKTEYRRENIVVKDILFVEGMREYLQINLEDRKIMTKMSFKALLELLTEKDFIMVHKSWLVNVPKIESIERNRIKIAGKLIPIGESFKEAFWKRIDNNK